jgi:hypothetical protein
MPTFRMMYEDDYGDMQIHEVVLPIKRLIKCTVVEKVEKIVSHHDLRGDKN